MAVTRKSTYLLLSLGVLVLDQLSKWWIERTIPLHGSRPVIPGFLDLTRVENKGIAFGLLAADGLSRALLLVGLGLAALVLITVYFWQTPLSQPRLLTALALVLGGAAGNLMDRIAAGSVTDFIDVYVRTYHWYTFNIADSAITIGIVLLSLDLLLSRRSDDSTTDLRPAESSPSDGS